jgi:hypothetical protein
MRAVRATGVSLACLVAGGLLAAPAGAAIQTSSKSVPVLSGKTASVEATCATGTVPVSAGFASSFFNFLQGGLVPVGSVRLDDGSRAIGTNAGGPPRTLTDYAYCDTKPRVVVTRSSPPVQLPPGSQRTATASCPTASVPISGGYRFRNGSNGSGAAVESRRVRGGWEVSGYNGSGSAASTLTAVVHCQKHGAPLEGQSSKQTLGTFDTGSAQTPCPAGTRIVSGGFNGHLRTLSTSLRVALPLASRRVQNAWRVTATSADSPTAVLTAFAYCEPS